MSGITTGTGRIDHFTKDHPIQPHQWRSYPQRGSNDAQSSAV
jgi:hypothetical protein